MKKGKLKELFNKYIKGNNKIVFGLKTGKWLYFYDNGNIESEGNFFLNSKFGKWKNYYDDGSIRSIAKYDFIGSLEHYTVRFYDNDGITVHNKSFFINNSLQYQVTYSGEVSKYLLGHIMKHLEEIYE